MTISIWRYSHLTLAISSFVFILIASVTGIILAFEPISNQLKPYAISNQHKISIAQTLKKLQQEHNEIVTLTINEHQFLITNIIDKNGKNTTFYTDPCTGKKLGNIDEKATIYKFATNLHRSLFLKSTGRFLVALFCFLLFLIAVTGTVLITKRQGGFSKFFSKVVYEDFKQFWHVILGKYTILPIIIITFSGMYLSLEKFSLLPKTNIKHSVNFDTLSTDNRTEISNFKFFKNTYLSQLKSIEFPFSSDKEDYFIVKLHNKELLINQFTGEVISSKQLSWVKIISNWSLFLHTGRGTIVWSIILMLSCFAILFFMYSGFAMTLERKQKSSLPKNKFSKDKSEIIILVGSETGNTYRMATAIFKALIKANKPTFITSLNNYSSYKDIKHLLIFTSTYGEGDPPINATKFKELFIKNPPQQSIQFSVVGFGSKAYPDYCKFAMEVDELLANNRFCKQQTLLHKINNQSFIDFKYWALKWSKSVEIPIELKQELRKLPKQDSFRVIEKTKINIDNTFIIRLRPTKKINFTSGDLLAITPNKDNITRLYSIGKIENDMIISVKKHEFGICSNLLFTLKKNDILQATIQKNRKFHSPKKPNTTILIANGTGIGPFLGMLQQNQNNTHLFWGGRTKKSFEIYKPYIQNCNNKNIHIAYSQEKNKNYVQDLLMNQNELIVSTLENNNSIMICGSVAMMNGVLVELEKICKIRLNKPLKHYMKHIKIDCY